MDDIKRVRLGDIAELITKGTTPTTLGYDFQDEGVNFLKIECFDENGNFLPEKVAFISEECNEKLKRSQLKEGDVLFSIAGAIGRVAIVTEEMLPANTNQALAIIRITDENVYLPYIKLILTSPIVKKQFEKKKQGVAQLNLSLKDINEIVIPLPDKKRQIEYAELFGKLYGVITLRNTQLSDMDNLIKARFVEMFGNPEVNNMDWPEAMIGDNCFVTKLAGFEYTKYINYEATGDVVMVKAQNVKNGVLNDKDLSYISNDVSDSLPRSQLAPGDVVMTYVGANIGDVAIIDDRHKYHLAPNVAKIRPDAEKYDSMFFMHMLMMKTDYIMRNSADTAKAALGMERIRKLIVFMPPIELQARFSEFVKQVDKSKVAVQKALDETQTLFDSLMQEYFG